MSRAAAPARFGPTDVVATRRADGALLLRSPHALEPYPDRITDRLDYWAEQAPDRTLVAQRTAQGDWRKLSYAEARARARRVAAALIERGLSEERPVAVLSGNDLEHALIELGALYAGVPYAPISPAYSLLSADFGKLRQALRLLTPGLIYAADESFVKAVAAAAPADAEIVYGKDFAKLEAEDSPRVCEAHARVGPDTIAKFLFTSGSTGQPKAVINTQRMWCSNQAMIRTMLAFLREEPPVVVGWAPWHHTAAGNHDFGLALYNGGSYFLDEGKPMPGAIAATVRNLREISPTYYFNVPKGYEALLPHLRGDAALRRNFFRRLRLLWFAGAALPQQVYDEMRAIARAERGEPVPFLTGLGATETAPMVLARLVEAEDATNMGVPAPGVELKLVPLAGRYEMRVRGPHVTPGYWRQPELTAAAFDEEGWYRLGDAFELADPQDPAKGLLFRGRIAEDFKLATGTWVHVGPLRAAFLAAFAPLARDVVIAGEGRDAVGALVVPDAEVCAALGGRERVGAAFGGRDGLRAAFEERLAAFAARATGSSNRVERLMLLEEPPSLDTGEMTDKGSINQRAVLARRAKLVEALYAELPAADVLVAAPCKPA